MGGSKTQVVQAPTAPAPSPSESAQALYEAKLKYDAPVAQQEFDIQEAFMPKQAKLYQDLYNQYYPQIARSQQALQQELYPEQSKILEAGASKALERLSTPSAMTPQEEAAQLASRTEAVGALQKAIRERANLGGALYGGRSAAAEAKSVSDMIRSFEEQDYARRFQAQQAAQQAAIPYMQILYPQIGTQQPNIQPYQYEKATPSADTLYNAMYQASQPQSFLRPGSNLNLGILGQWGTN